MKAHIEAIRALLTGLPYTVYYGDVQGAPTYPYVLLWSTTGRLVSDEVCGTQDDLNDRIGVTMVAAEPLAVLDVVRHVRAALIGARPTVPGRHVQRLRLADSQNIQPDESVRLPRTNSHPLYGVDLYRLISEPAPEEAP